MKFWFVPVLLTLASPALADLLVPMHPLRARTLLQAEDFETVAGSRSGAVVGLEEIVGQESVVALYPGRPVMRNDIAPRTLVERNAIVPLIFVSGALTISTEGRALDRGGVGQMVAVMNMSSKVTVFGRVRPDGSVEVGK